MFNLGTVYLTQGAKEVLSDSFLGLGAYLPHLLDCFSNGDFGTLCEEDVPQNKHSIEQGVGTVMGVFSYNDQPIWVITQLGEGAYTTVLLPEEY